MADELTLESLEGMGKADYIKAFKNKAVWKKAKAAIFLVDYKLDGKKTVIALPFKKESEMKMKMKEIKKTKKHVLKKTGGGLITVENDGPEGLKAKVEILLGGLNPFILQDKALELFGRINATLEVKLAEGAELETDESEANISTGETDVNSKTTDDDVNSSQDEEVVKNNGQPKTEDKNKEIKLIIAKIVKMNQTINLKNGLEDTELKTAEDIKSAIREFANLLKNADASARAEYGETFLKTKKIYAKIEEEIKKLKELDKELESELNDALGIGVKPNNKENEEEDAENQTDDESDEEEDDEEPTTKKEAIAKSKELMDEINDLIKSVKLFEMA
jgi:hypothetical protein